MSHVAAMGGKFQRKEDTVLIIDSTSKPKVTLKRTDVHTFFVLILVEDSI